MSEDEDLVGQVFGWIGSAFSLFFFIAPVVPYSQLIKEEITYKESPGILLICTFFNCVLWVNYGLKLDRFIVYFANGMGGVITLIFITIFLIYYANKKFLISFLLTLGLIAILSIFDLIFFLFVPYEPIGIIASITNVLMYAAPGEKIITVFKTGNYKLIPIWSNIAGIACSGCWLIYGIYLIDWNIMVPNGLGLIFSIFQIVIFILYKKKKGEGKEKDDEEKKNVDAAE